MGLEIFGTLKRVSRFLVITAFMLSFLLFCFMIISVLDYAKVWSENSLFYGASFLSPLWLLIPILILALLLFFLEKKVFSISVVIIYVIYLAVLGNI